MDDADLHFCLFGWADWPCELYLQQALALRHIDSTMGLMATRAFALAGVLSGVIEHQGERIHASSGPSQSTASRFRAPSNIGWPLIERHL